MFKAADSPPNHLFMLILIAAVLAATAFVVLVRLLWLSTGPERHTTAITLAAAVLVIGLAALAATGRLHWLIAAGAALVPFLRRGVRLIRYLPWLSAFAGSLRKRSRPRAGPEQRSRQSAGIMQRAEALEILGLGTQPTRDEILAAHRRLIQKLHPDRGGTTYLAQQLNEAKRRLLEDL